MLISKKDLLNETGISYGQLYRWKRENLIPEEWFIKQPTFTGQETYFPKTKILNRIKAIQELKDRYSLQQLAKMLSPEISERMFTEKDLRIIEEISPGLIPCFCKVFEKSSFTYVEVLFLIAISTFYKEYDLQLTDVENMCAGMDESLSTLKQTEYLCLLLDINGVYFVAIQDENSTLFLDKRIKNVSHIRLNDVSANMKIKYRKSFNFKFDDSEEELFKDPNGEGVLV